MNENSEKLIGELIDEELSIMMLKLYDLRDKYKLKKKDISTIDSLLDECWRTDLLKYDTLIQIHKNIKFINKYPVIAVDELIYERNFNNILTKVPLFNIVDYKFYVKMLIENKSTKVIFNQREKEIARVKNIETKINQFLNSQD